MAREKPVIGWREWVELPLWLPVPLKAKIDSGARTSAIHCFRQRRFSDGGSPHVAFHLHPVQRAAHPDFEVVAAIRDERLVRSSNGLTERRLVVETSARLGTVEWPIEITLSNRDEMGFRMLLGRVALRRRFLIDAGRSYVQGEPL